LWAYSVWDTTSSKWVLNEKTVTERNDKGRVINSESLKRSDGILRGDKEEYEYDDKGDRLSEAYYLWDSEGDAWRGDYRIVNKEKDDDGNPVAAYYYRWNINKWERSGSTLYYPDAEQKAPIVLARTIFEVAEAFSHKYKFDLRSLLPDLTGFGKLTYTIGVIKNDDGILDDIDDMQIEGDYLIISIKVTVVTTQSARLRAGTLEEKLASIPIIITSENYGDFQATIEVKTSSKKRVNIEAAMEGGVYSGAPFAYAGKPVITEDSETEDVVTGLTLSILYETETGALSETAPVNAGDYKLILSVPADNEDYVGDLSISFTIEQRPIQIVAEDKAIQAGSALPEFTYKVTGGVADETLITGTPILSSTANIQVAGTYPIELDLKNVTPTANYKFADKAAIAGTLTVTAADDTEEDTSDDTEEDTSDDTEEDDAEDDPNDSVGTEEVSQEIIVFFNESVLTVDSPAAETIAVYDFNGRLLYADKKPEGKTVFTVGNAGGKIVIVKGSAGWTKKIAR
jgi:hypothetical protein